MRNLAVWALTLAGCASVHGPLDVITPDELTLGHGKTTGLMNGGYTGHNDMFEYEGESDSTYVALTWDIPSFEDPALTREERRAVREANYAADTTLDEEESFLEATKEVPSWVPWAMGGSLAVLLLIAGLYSRRQPEW